MIGKKKVFTDEVKQMKVTPLLADQCEYPTMLTTKMQAQVRMQ